MADMSDNKSSAELQREIDAQRNRVENTIDEIQARLSPGQLVDEVLSYTKNGGGDFVANLSGAVSRNPLPVALLGIGLAWLIAGPRDTPHTSSASRHDWEGRGFDDLASAETGSPSYSTYGDYHDLPYATVTGGMQRLGHVVDDTGRRYSEFVDDAGKKFRALSDDAGNRAGHFMDETGKSFRGFMDAAGNRIGSFQDEAGNLIDEASGWASHTFRMAGEAMQQTRRAMGHQADSIGRQAQHLGGMAMDAGGDLQHQADRALRSTTKLLDQQPLIGGALVFALGAALGALLPRTAEEDRLLGEAADKVKAEAGHEAEKLYAEGKEQAAQMYEQARDRTSDLYAEAKDTVIGLVDKAQQPGGGSSTAS